MDTPKVGSPRSTDSPRRLPDNATAPMSPRTSTPSVLNKERDQMLLLFGKNDTLSQLVFEIVKFTDEMSQLIPAECKEAEYLKGLISQISVGLAQVETAFEQSNLKNCVHLLKAAKGNHVTLLACLQELEQGADGQGNLPQCQARCKTLGVKIVAFMQLITERLNAEQQQQQQQQMPPLSPRPSSPFASSPRSSSPGYSISPERSGNKKAKKTDAALSPSRGGQMTPNSPERGTGNGRLEKMPSPKSGKRVQGDEDSPKMKYSPAKRFKVQGVEQPASSHSETESRATVQSSSTTTTTTNTTTTTTTTTNPTNTTTTTITTNPTNSASLAGPRSPSKVPKFDWSSAKPANTGPHSSLSMTPRSARQASTDSKPIEKQVVDSAPALASPPSSDAGTGKDVNGQLPSTPASPSSVQSPSTVGSPRRRQLSPSKSIPPQPKPRPPSMLFMSPPIPSGLADVTEKSSQKPRDSVSTAPPAPSSTQTSTSTITAPSATNVAPREEDTADI